jgi:hypothetical protein
MTTENTNRQARVYRLCQELEEAKLRKKSVTRAASDEIKRIQAEIKELLESEEEQLP